MKQVGLKGRLLLGRFLTRSGDQAWDFAVPITLLIIFPGQLRIAALYYFLSKLINVLLLPRMASLIDKLNRRSAARLGIFLQLAGVVVGAGAIFWLANLPRTSFDWMSASAILAFAVLVAGGVTSSLGSSFMDIAIANDLVPASVEISELPTFNSRLRQLDLFTEVTSPIIAGLLLTMSSPNLVGFLLVAIWNVVSFFPELALINSVLNERPALLEKKIIASEQTKKSLFKKLTDGWRSFSREPIALVALAYACLWLSVLSPHGVLLAGFLKDGWNMPEWLVGVFRGLGALFGLISTIVFPWAERRWGLLKSSRNFILYQAATLSVALVFFFSGHIAGQIGFLIFILFSRVGLYGFSLGEMQIRQVGISAHHRGEVNGFATALTGIATLVLYGSGTLLPSTEDFWILIVGSVGFVILGCLIYLYWFSKQLGDERDRKFVR